MTMPATAITAAIAMTANHGTRRLMSVSMNGHGAHLVAPKLETICGGDAFTQGDTLEPAHDHRVHVGDAGGEVCLCFGERLLLERVDLTDDTEREMRVVRQSR